MTIYPLLTAAQLGQKVAVLDYVEPSVKGKIEFVVAVDYKKYNFLFED